VALHPTSYSTPEAPTACTQGAHSLHMRSLHTHTPGCLSNGVMSAAKLPHHHQMMVAEQPPTCPLQPTATQPQPPAPQAAHEQSAAAQVHRHAAVLLGVCLQLLLGSIWAVGHVWKEGVLAYTHPPITPLSLPNMVLSSTPTQQLLRYDSALTHS
jgi:hypothetical protein